MENGTKIQCGTPILKDDSKVCVVHEKTRIHKIITKESNMKAVVVWEGKSYDLNFQEELPGLEPIIKKQMGTLKEEFGGKWVNQMAVSETGWSILSQSWTKLSGTQITRQGKNNFRKLLYQTHL